MQPTILLTIDVEDWFQVENFKSWIPFSTWSSRELRVEKNTHRLLDLFDTYVSTKNPINATFFILGWIAERLPNLVREIHSRGHEVASHGYHHNLCPECSLDDLKTDLINSKKLLEDIIGDRVYGYRAPSFAISNDILKTILDCGYLYDSSYNSFALHGRYGHVDLSERPTNGFAVKLSEKFYEPPISNLKFSPREIHDSDSETHFTGVKSQKPKAKILYELPISNLKTKKFVIPWGGGAYFRIIPFLLFKIGIKNILKNQGAYIFYIHPWELDSEQPRLHEASLGFRFRHYTNIQKTMPKLKKLMKKFDYCEFISCSEYIQLQYASTSTELSAMN